MNIVSVGMLVAGMTMAAAVAAAQPRLVAIANFGDYPVLQESVDGFMETVRKSGLEVEFTYQHAAFRREDIRTVLDQLQAKKPALIFTVTSPVTRRAIRVVDKSIPLVFGASSIDPVAANFVPSFDRGGERHTGASMMPNFDASLAFVRQLLPDAKRIGTLYDPAVERDFINSEELAKSGGKLGLEVVSQAVEREADIPAKIQALKPKIDALFLISSNLVQEFIPVVARVAGELKIPTVNTIYNADLKDQMVGFHTISFRKNGEHAGAIAVRILKGENPTDIPPYLPQAEDFTVLVSPKGLAALGRQVPDGLKGCKCFVAD